MLLNNGKDFASLEPQRLIALRLLFNEVLRSMVAQLNIMRANDKLTQGWSLTCCASCL